MSTEIAIVGAGPWGLAVLDRLVMTARARPSWNVCVSLIDPEAPGPGVHRPGLEDFLLLNTVCAQIDSFSAGHFGEAPLHGAMPFLQWLHAVRRIDAGAHSFVPRASFGAYLRYVHEVLRDNAPRNLVLKSMRHVVGALSAGADGAVRIVLDGAAPLTVDHVYVCTGHGLPAAPRESAIGPAHAAPLDPYPIARLQEHIAAGRAVGISGLGLVAVDVVAALTEGRGGCFVADGGDTLRYLPSGREPVMFVYSRSGTPFSCRPAVSLDLATLYEPIYCTEAHLALRRAARGAAGLELLDDVLPMLAAEMRAAYLLRALALCEGADAAQACRETLGTLAASEVEAFCLKRLPESAAFCPEKLLLPGPHASCRSFADFSAAFTDRLAFDVMQARQGEHASPYKHAVEMLRVLRDFIRRSVEFDALAPASRRSFHDAVAPRISQLVVGPPISRGREWLALMRAGLLKVDLGPSPEIERDHARGLWRARSSRFDIACATCLDHIVRGHVRPDDFHASGTSLLSALYRSGLCSAAGHTLAPRIDRAGHPIDATGVPLRAVTLLGVPTEGATYFNHYLPSPKSRARAFEIIQSAIDELLDDQRRASVASMRSSAARTSAGCSRLRDASPRSLCTSTRIGRLAP